MPSQENTILDEIYAILTGISSIQEVFKYEKNVFAGYPAVTIVWAENESSMETTTQDLVKFHYTIRVHQEMKQRGGENADRILRDIIGDIRTTLDGNYSLNGLVNFLDPIPTTGGYQTREVGTVRVAEFELVANKLVTV